MAERLAAHPSNISRDTVFGFLNELEGAESDLGEFLAACREPRKRIKDIKKRIAEAGIEMRAFDRMREDEKTPAAVREREQRQYAMLMGFMRLPVGFQADLDLNGQAPGPLGSAEQLTIEGAGKKIGRAGHNADLNPYLNGTEEFAAWHNGWNAGQKEYVEALNSGTVTPKRGPGRPRKVQPEPASPANGVAEQPGA